MKIGFSSFSIGLLLIAIIVEMTPGLAANCQDGRDFSQNLPTVIGKEDQVLKRPYALKCDTVFIRKGVTTVVYPGSMLYFTRPSLNSVIKVEGTLLVKGTKNSYATFSGSVDSTRTGWETGSRLWGGIEIAEGGRLELEYVGFMGAPTPITAFSRQVIILNTWFKGSSGMILPDGSLYPLEVTWQAINNLNLTKGNSDRKETEHPANTISAKEKEALFKKPSQGFWTWKKVAGGAATLAVLGVGAAVYLMPEDAGPAKIPAPPVTTSKKSTLPVFDGGFPSTTATP